MKTDAWAILLRTYNLVYSEISKDLKENDLPSLEWYDILWLLERSPDHKLRFIEIGYKTDLAKYNISRITEKLKNEGLIKIESSEEDKRGLYAVLTPKGEALRKKMWIVYKKSIEKKFTDKLTANDTEKIIEILGKLKTN